VIFLKNRRICWEMIILSDFKRTLSIENVKQWFFKTWPIFPAMFYLMSFLVIVLFYLIGLSLNHPCSEINFPTFASFTELFKNEYFNSALINTTLFMILGTPLELITGLFLSFLIFRSFFMRGVIRSLFLIPLALPALVTAMLLFVLFDFPGGHINHIITGGYSWFPQVFDQPINWRGSKLFSMAIALFGKVWRDMPISMLILLAGINNIDPELFDAAKTMGASFRKRAVHVIMPLMIPSISVVLLLRSVEMWKEFIFPFVLAGRYHLLGTLIDFYYNEIGNSHMAATVSIIMVICIVFSTLILMKILELIQKLIVSR